MKIDWTTLPLPTGWTRRPARLTSGEAVVLLMAVHPAEALRIAFDLPSGGCPVLGLCRPPGRFCELEVRIGSGFWRHIRPAHFIDDREGGIQEAVLDPIAPGANVLEVRPVSRPGVACRLAWLRFEPTDGVEHQWRKHYVGAVCDSHGLFARGGVNGAEDIEAMLAPFVASDFDRICWGIGAGSFRMLFFSDVLPWFGDGKASFCNEANTRVAATMASLQRNGVDPIRVGVAFCHAHGMQFWASDRICHCWAPGGFNDDFAAPFYLEHQELRTVNADGQREATLSLAHRAFQELKIALYRELAERGVDGIYIDLLRKPGVMGVDAPVVEAFEKQTGRRPERKDFRSELWLRIRAGFVTSFMRRVRAAVDEVGARQGRRIPIAIQGFAGRTYTDAGMVDENLVQGYDIATWAREGLIDIFAPSTSRHYRPIALFHHAATLQGTNCALWGCLGQHDDSLFSSDYHHTVYFGNDPGKRITPIADLDARRVMNNAADCYAQGARGVFLWEAGEVPNCPTRWNELRMLGHRDEVIAARDAALGPFDGRHWVRQWRVRDDR